MELGSPSWLTAARRAVNASEDYRASGTGWHWPLGLGFLDPADHDRDRFALLDLRDGMCRGATSTDRATFEQAPFRLSASYSRWQRVLEQGADPMRCILLKQLRLDGDRLTAIRYLPAAKAMLAAMATLDVDHAVA